MKQLTFMVLLVGFALGGITLAEESPDFARTLEVECGSDAACRNVLIEKRLQQEDQYLDLEALEAQIVADGFKLNEEVNRQPQMAKRPSAQKK